MKSLSLKFRLSTLLFVVTASSVTMATLAYASLGILIAYKFVTMLSLFLSAIAAAATKRPTAVRSFAIVFFIVASTHLFFALKLDSFSYADEQVETVLLLKNAWHLIRTENPQWDMSAAVNGGVVPS